MAKNKNIDNKTRNRKPSIPKAKQTNSIPKSSILNQVIPPKKESNPIQPTPEVKPEPIHNQINISQKASTSISNIADVLSSTEPIVEQPKVDVKLEHNQKIKEKSTAPKVPDKQSNEVEKVSKKKSKAKKQSKESTTASSGEQTPKTLEESATSSSKMPHKLIQEPTIPESTTEVAIQKELAGPPKPTLYDLSKGQKRSLKAFLKDTNSAVNMDNLSKVTEDNLKQLGVNFTVNNGKVRLKLKPKLDTSATTEPPSVKNSLTDKLFTPVENPGIKTDGWGVIKDSQANIKGPNSPLTSNVANNTNATTSQTITNSSENSLTSGIDNNTKVQGPKPNSSSNTGTSQTGTNAKASTNDLKDVKVPKTLGVLDSIKQEVQVVKDAYLDKETKQIAKNLGIRDKKEISQIRSQLELDPLAEHNLDEMSFKRVTRDPIKKSLSSVLHGKLIPEDVETNIQKALEANYITKEGARHLSGKDVQRLTKSGVTEVIKESDSTSLSKLSGWGSRSGYSHSLKAAQNSSMAQRLFNVGYTTVNVKSVGEATLNSLGLDTRAQKALMAGQKGITGFLGATLNPVMGFASAVYALNQEDPLNEFLAQTAMSTMAVQGYRIGKSVGNLAPIKTLGKLGHIPRLVGGAIGGALSGGLAYGLIKAVGDLSSTESHVASTMKKYAKKDSMVNHQYTRESLSLRQAALQKLSSSSLNNRGQLLGSEATILRGGWSYGSGQDSM